MRAIKDFRKNWAYILYSIRSSLKAEISGSYLSFLWWVIEPLSYMIVYGIVFGLIFKSEEAFFPLFLFIGNSVWSFFSRTIASSTVLIKRNESIISRIYLPKYTLMVIELGINLFKLAVNGVIIVLMMFIYGVRISACILYLPLVLILLAVVTFGIGSVLMHIGVYVEDLSKAMTILLNVLMYFSGIFYSIENRLPYPYGYIANRVNPVSFIISSFRNIMIYDTGVDLLFSLIWLLIGVLISVFGIRLLYRNENNYVKVL